MARGKHAAALFEVIHSGRHPNKPVLTTPKWWFKRQNERNAALSAIAAASPASSSKPRTPFDQTVPGDGALDDVSNEKTPVATKMTETTEMTAVASTSNSSAVSDAPTVEIPPTKIHAICGVSANASPDIVTENDADLESMLDASEDHVEPPPFLKPRAGFKGSLNRSSNGSSKVSSSKVSGRFRKLFALDSERHLLSFQLTYTNAAVAGFTVLVALGLAFVVGRKMSHGPALAIASETTESLRSKPAHPDVLSIAGVHSSKTKETESSQVREPESAISSKVPDAPLVGGITSDAAKKLRAAAPTTAPSSIALNNADREIGMNYVVIQSYPDEKIATDARDALQKAGVACTVEQGLRGLPAAWFCVVGSQGFQRISSADCQDYVRKLDQISKQFATSKRSFKAFQPMAYKWDKAKA